jgi:hypothetical protein
VVARLGRGLDGRIWIETLDQVLESLIFTSKASCTFIGLGVVAGKRRGAQSSWVPLHFALACTEFSLPCRYYCDYCDTYLTHDSVSASSLPPSMFNVSNAGFMYLFL